MRAPPDPQVAVADLTDCHVREFEQQRHRLQRHRDDLVDRLTLVQRLAVPVEVGHLFGEVLSFLETHRDTSAWIPDADDVGKKSFPFRYNI